MKPHELCRIKPGWIEGLYDFCRAIDDKESIVEIGSHLGESAWVFAQYFEVIICVDPWPDNDSFKIFIDNVLEKLSPTVVQAIRLSSLMASMEIKRPVSGVYIDAVHDYPDVKQDIELWLPHCRSWIGGHDYCGNFPGVVKAVDERFGNIHVFQDTSWLVKL